MTKTAKQAIMDYFGVTLVPESLLKEIEATISEQVIGEDWMPQIATGSFLNKGCMTCGDYLVGSVLCYCDEANEKKQEQRQALREALYGKETN